MNLNKKDKSKSLSAPFRKLFKRVGSRSPSPLPTERNDSDPSTNHLRESASVVAPAPAVLSMATPVFTSIPLEQSLRKFGNENKGLGGGLGEDCTSGGRASLAPAITIMNSQESGLTSLENHGDLNEQKANKGGQERVADESTTGQRAAAVAYKGLKEGLRLVVRCSDAFPIVKSATQGILEIFDRYDTVTGIPGELADLKDKLQGLALILQENNSQSIRDRLGGLARTFEEKNRIITTKLERNLGSRIIESTEDVEFLSHEIRSITFAIEIVMMDVNLKTYTVVSELQCIALLDKLKYVEGAGFDHEDCQGCANGTHMLLLADLLTWATECKGKPIFWLNGMAGTGKTAVTETFCNLLAGKGILGSSFFCSRKTTDRRKVNLIIPSLASALAYKYSEFQEELIRVLQNCLDPTGMDLEKQFKTLLIEPARIAFAKHSGSIILAVDALDECEDQQAAEMFLKIILKEKSLGLLCFFITSRPETRIRKGFSNGAFAGVRLQDIEAHIVKADIRVYLLAALEEIEDLQSEYNGLWPPAELDIIVEKSGNLFIYAATGVKYISDEKGDPSERLRKYASITPPSNAVEAIDEVYLFVLKEAFYQIDADEQQRVQLCLQTVVCALEPLSIAMYSALLGMSVLQVRRAFASLHSVVQMPEKEHNGRIVLYHASFSDYLTSISRTNSAIWHINVLSSHTMLLDQCLQVMMSKLHFNIAKAITSYQTNKAQNLYVDADLEYTCVFWSNHLFLSVAQPALILDTLSTKIEQFFSEKFLYWLEVLSVANQVQYAASSLSHIYRITKSFALRNMCREFATFISKHLVAIKLSTPHIYLSALPWATPDSIIGQKFLSKFEHLPKIIDSKTPDAWEPLVIQLHGHKSWVNCITYSPDGKHLASGSADRTIRIWDAETGQQTLQINVEKVNELYHGVRSLAYSPTAQYIVSGSEDARVRIWDTKTGGQKLKPLLGHNKAVLSVAVSPNGSYIGSGSTDKTAILWDFQTGKQSYKAFRGHQEHISSVAFSPNNSYLISADFGCSIRIWNVQTGQIVSKVQKDYKENGFLYSIAVAPDGQSLLCALYNRTLKIWNLWSNQDEQIFSGHLGSAISAAYSSNGAFIVSGSDDNTVRVWSTETKKEVISPLYGHSSKIKSVAFAPDGSSVASGSADKTISIWHISEALHSGHANEESTQSVVPSKLSGSAALPFKGHMDYINSVAFLLMEGFLLLEAMTMQWEFGI